MDFVRNLFGILAVVVLSGAGLLSASEKSADPQSYSLGNPSSKKEVFLFTNWYCHHCQALEPSLQKFLPKMVENAQVTFVDLAFEGSEDMAKFNLAYLLNNKKDYLRIRPILDRLIHTNPDASREAIAAELKKNQIDVAPLNDETFAQLKKNFGTLMLQFDVTKTPTLVVVNRTTQAKKKLNGEQITEKNVMEAINGL